MHNIYAQILKNGYVVNGIQTDFVPFQGNAGWNTICNNKINLNSNRHSGYQGTEKSEV